MRSDQGNDLTQVTWDNPKWNITTTVSELLSIVLVSNRIMELDDCIFFIWCEVASFDVRS